MTPVPTQLTVQRDRQNIITKWEVLWRLLQERNRGAISVIVGSGQDSLGWWHWSWDLEITDDRFSQRRLQGRRELGPGGCRNYISRGKGHFMVAHSLPSFWFHQTLFWPAALGPSLCWEPLSPSPSFTCLQSTGCFLICDAILYFSVSPTTLKCNKGKEFVLFLLYPHLLA